MNTAPFLLEQSTLADAAWLIASSAPIARTCCMILAGCDMLTTTGRDPEMCPARTCQRVVQTGRRWSYGTPNRRPWGRPVPRTPDRSRGEDRGTALRLAAITPHASVLERPSLTVRFA